MSTPAITPDMLRQMQANGPLAPQLLPIAQAQVVANKADTDAMPAPAIASNPFGDAGAAKLVAMPAPAQPNVAPSQTLTDVNKLHEMSADGPGVNQIKNPWLRGAAKVVDALSGAVAPGFAAWTPGTTVHHNIMMGKQAALVGQDNAQDLANVTLADQTSQAEQRQAQAVLEQAKVAAVSDPRKAIDPSKTVQTDDGVYQLNPNTGKYDIRVGDRVDKPKPIEEQAYEYAVAQGKNPLEAYAAVYGAKNPKADNLPQQYLDALASGDTVKAGLIKRAIRDTETQPKIDVHAGTEKAPSTMLMVPDGKGNMVATVVHPGDTVAPNAVTAAGMGKASADSQKATAGYQNIIDEAQTAHQLALEAANGNAPADVDLALSYFKTMRGASGSGIRFTQAEQNLIKGARNSAGDIQAVAQKVLGGGQMFTPEQRSNILKVIDIHAQAARNHLSPTASPADANTPPPGASVRDYTQLEGKK